MERLGKYFMRKFQIPTIMLKVYNQGIADTTMLTVYNQGKDLD